MKRAIMATGLMVVAVIAALVATYSALAPHLVTQTQISVFTQSTTVTMVSSTTLTTTITTNVTTGSRVVVTGELWYLGPDYMGQYRYYLVVPTQTNGQIWPLLNGRAYQIFFGDFYTTNGGLGPVPRVLGIVKNPTCSTFTGTLGPPMPWGINGFETYYAGSIAASSWQIYNGTAHSVSPCD